MGIRSFAKFEITEGMALPAKYISQIAATIH
jgi:hypothetical protein